MPRTNKQTIMEYKFFKVVPYNDKGESVPEKAYALVCDDSEFQSMNKIYQECKKEPGRWIAFSKEQNGEQIIVYPYIAN